MAFISDLSNIASHMIRVRQLKRPHFCNVDLDIESASPLRSLARELGDRVSVMFSGRMNGRHCLFVEIAGAGRSQDSIINAFCTLIEGLSPKGGQVWDEAARKEFDCGYEARLSSARANRLTIRPGILRRVAKLGAGVAVTIYREEI